MSSLSTRYRDSLFWPSRSSTLIAKGYLVGFHLAKKEVEKPPAPNCLRGTKSRVESLISEMEGEERAEEGGEGNI